MIRSVELTLWSDSGESVSFDLSPVQLEAVCKILKLKFEGDNVTCLSDESLKLFMDKTVDKWILKD